MCVASFGHDAHVLLPGAGGLVLDVLHRAVEQLQLGTTASATAATPPAVPRDRETGGSEQAGHAGDDQGDAQRVIAHLR